jgi:hypothetical protein
LSWVDESTAKEPSCSIRDLRDTAVHMFCPQSPRRNNPHNCTLIMAAYPRASGSIEPCTRPSTTPAGACLSLSLFPPCHAFRPVPLLRVESDHVFAPSTRRQGSLDAGCQPLQAVLQKSSCTRPCRLPHSLPRPVLLAVLLCCSAGASCAPGAAPPPCPRTLRALSRCPARIGFASPSPPRCYQRRLSENP